MSYIKPIFEKATIRGIADYLLFGLAPDEDTRDYEARLVEVFEKYKKVVLQFDENMECIFSSYPAKMLKQ